MSVAFLVLLAFIMGGGVVFLTAWVFLRAGYALRVGREPTLTPPKLPSVALLTDSDTEEREPDRNLEHIGKRLAALEGHDDKV